MHLSKIIYSDVFLARLKSYIIPSIVSAPYKNQEYVQFK